MKFSRIVGDIDKALVREAEEALATVFAELSLRYDNPSPKTGLGGDPFIFTLAYPTEQVCTLAMPTAATDGKRFYWNPEFIKKLNRIGLRIVIAHEAFHAIFMHPARRGSRVPWLWNIAVDYIVNYNIMLDFKQRNVDPVKFFRDNLGDFLPIKKYVEALKGVKGGPPPKREKSCYFADPDLPEDLRKPEAIYELLYNSIPKCPKCGKPDPGKNHAPGQKQKQKGKDKSAQNGQGDDESDDEKTQKGKGKAKGKGDPKDEDGDGSGQGQKGKGKSKSKGGQDGDDHDHDSEGGDCDHGDGGDGQGDQDGDGDGDGWNCGSGAGDGDPTGYGSLVDDHMDAEGTQDELAKKLADAASISQKLAGRMPSGLEDEIGQLLAPKLRWQDIIRSRIQRVRQGSGRNDWNRPKTRPMFAGLFIPKRKDYFARFRCLLDTSGSMSQDDMTYGISQLQTIDDRGEGTITPADAQIYWQDTTVIKKANREELSKIKIVGRGGTVFCDFFNDYEKELGPADFIIVITDGYLCPEDLNRARKPKCEVFWILTSSHSFHPPFGRVFDLKNE